MSDWRCNFKAAGSANYITIINNEIKEQLQQRDLILFDLFHTIQSNREYFLTREGIIIYFKQNEYTSFAEGMPEFLIPFSKFN